MDINKEQRRASNPLTSAWVSASAGSGKTKVLTDRVLNLLLMNGQPEKLLCLTFTKAAAAEMSNRINEILKNWAVCPENELVTYIENLTGEIPENDVIIRARRLFAKVLETPGQMKIMTVHSFCQSVLKRFPLEAGIPPQFDIADDTKAQVLLSKALNEVLSDISFQSDITILSQYKNKNDLIELLQNLFSWSGKLSEFKGENNLDTLIFNLKKKFNIEKYLTEKEVISDYFNPEMWPDIQKKFLKKDGEIFKNKLSEPKAQKAYLVSENLKNFQLVSLTKNILHLAFGILEKYQLHKTISGYLDYNDLIIATKNLLHKSNAAAWVLFKLDGGLDHILIDEAQDTNPDQWKIIQLLAEEFFAGEDHHDTIRTIFAVGDKKQSIYSFQGADPNEFERMRLFFQEKVKTSENDFENVPLNISFRSTKPVLDLVNFLLESASAKKGVLFGGEKAFHIPYRQNDAGLVEIWPLELHIKTDTPKPWKPPVDRIKNTSATTRLAEKIAYKINSLLNSDDILSSTGKKIQPGDFLILVQKRNIFMSELVRLLKEYHIPVAGVDRLDLKSHIAIQDLIAAAKFALLPEDDLNLACLLKSPFIGLSEDDLFHVAYNRGAQSLWGRVQSLFPDKAKILSDILSQADKIPPYEFFATILGPLNGRKHFLERLGYEAGEALDEFLNLVLTFEQTEIPSLQRLVDWFEDQKIEIKRDMDSGQNAVRIMTVHRSKGLQGNIVFLPQTRFIQTHRPDFVWIDNKYPIWVPNKSVSSQIVERYVDDYMELLAEENKRLLYVAVTRARDRLYVCGYENAKNAKEDNWYDLIKSAVPYQPDSKGIIRWEYKQNSAVSLKKNNDFIEPEKPLPLWALTPPEKEETVAKPVMPSQQETGPKPVSALKEGMTDVLKQGRFVHKLLQYLPDMPEKKWDNVIKKLATDNVYVPDNLIDLLKKEQFKKIFGPSSLGEVPIVGIWNNQQISGQIDRLVILDNEVWIIDFKTNKSVPNNLKDVPIGYIKQLESYKGLTQNIFPDKVIKTFLLWTENITLMEIPL